MRNTCPRKLNEEGVRSKLQATRDKLQATSYKLQATRSKLQGASYKLQATRSKLQGVSANQSVSVLTLLDFFLTKKDV